MNARHIAAAIALIVAPDPGNLFAQIILRVASPELTYSSSPRGNGMGGAEATIPASDAAGTIANPGQLGLFSLDNLFSASTYTPKTKMLPSLDLPYTMSVSALNAGINLQYLLSLPFNAGIGVGYSRTYVDRGEFLITGPSGPTPIGTAAWNESYENYSAGLGLDYYVRLGIGMNFKQITSRMPGIRGDGTFGELTATPSATDFGILMDIPVPDIVTGVSGMPLSIAKGIDPFLDVSLCYVKLNVGGEVKYA
ncbi:MAG TPA: hypothetical protein VMF59_11855, partial [Bacteroidota bacterium]|nr:hypothetical protein [Bacteroidota bacterium]